MAPDDQQRRRAFMRASFIVTRSGFEPETPSLKVKCSTN